MRKLNVIYVFLAIVCAIESFGQEQAVIVDRYDIFGVFGKGCIYERSKDKRIFRVIVKDTVNLYPYNYIRVRILGVYNRRIMNYPKYISIQIYGYCGYENYKRIYLGDSINPEESLYEWNKPDGVIAKRELFFIRRLLDADDKSGISDIWQNLAAYKNRLDNEAMVLIFTYDVISNG